MSNLTSEILKSGYLLFLKALFEVQMIQNACRQTEGYFKTFIAVLQHVNYGDVACCIKGQLSDCNRGEYILPTTRLICVLCGENRRKLWCNISKTLLSFACCLT